VLFALADAELAKWEAIKTQDLPKLNLMVRESGVDLVKVKTL
jgi:hypothetical protein